MMYTKVRQGMGITDESINELELFKKKIMLPIQAQDLDKLKVLDWIDLADGWQRTFFKFL